MRHKQLTQIQKETKMVEQNQTVKSCAALAASFFLSACNSTTIPGISNPSVGVQTEGNDQHLYASFQATALNIPAGATLPLPIPGLTNATIGVTPGVPQNGKPGGTVFQLDIDLTDLGNGITYEDQGLPDGRALPGIVGGVLPSWNFTIDGISVYLYLQNNVAFGLFVPIDLTDSTGFTLPDTLSLEIDDSRGNRVGEIYAIPTQGGGTSSGLLLLIPFVNNGSAVQTNLNLN
jgi:hypothetical protein